MRIGIALAVLFVCARVARAGALYLRPDPAAGVVQTGPRPDAKAPVAAGVADLAALLEPIRARAKLPAMGAAIISHGKVVAIGATGVRKAGGSTPVTIHDRWHLGSDTKAMTATLIAGLVEEGKLSWDTKVREFFRERVPEVDPAWSDVTLEQLLCHRGGVPADLGADGLWGRLWSFKGTNREARMELARGVLKRPPLSKPGEKYLYSNAGFAIAGAMAEEVTDTPWEELMARRLFAPLGITGFGFGAPGTPRQEDQPWGHTGANTPIEPGPGGDNPPAIGPAGTANMTLEDWAKFVAAHIAGERGEGKLLKPETWKKLHEAPPGAGEKYAFGWLVTKRPWAAATGPDGKQTPGVVYTHSGSNTMWYCVAWLAPERDFAVLVTCNQGGNGAAKACDEACGALIRKFEEMAKAGEDKTGG
jgi:CubicO group peptidase (beta-lactamase class C family)